MESRTFFSFFRNTHGQSLVEILVALSVAAILIGGATTAITVYLRSNYETKTQQSAVFLAQELMDNTRSYAEGNWENIYGLNKSSSTLYSLITSSSPFTASSSAESITIDNLTYTRSFYVDNVNRDLCGSGAITSSSTDACTTPGAAGVAEDPSTQLITVQVQLPAPRTAVIRLQEYVTRSKIAVLNQSDWSGGANQESFSTSSGFPSAVNNRFASSSGIGFSTSSQIVLTGVVNNGELMWATSSVPNLSAAQGIVASSSYLYIGGSDSIGSRLEKRLISTGAIAAPDAGLVGYWPFDEGIGSVASDYSTSASAGVGTLTTGPVWATGKYGGALYFNGTSSYVSVADSSALLPSSAITMAYWARRDGPGNTLGNSIEVAKGNGNYLGVCYSGSNSAIFSLVTPTQVYSTSSIPCAAYGEWHHYAGTYNGSVNNIYIDGVAVATTSDTGAIVDTAGNLNIGRFDGGNYNFNGLLDDVRIYNRALSNTEIAALYAATPSTTWGMSYGSNQVSGLAVDGSFIYTAGQLDNVWVLEKRNISDGSIQGAGASAYWSFNDGTGGPTYDVSGNGIIGNLGVGSASPTWVTSTGALRFDGGDYVTASTTQGLNPLASTTASAWFKTTSTVASAKILGKTTGCASTGYLIWMDENAVGDGRVSWWVGNGPWLDSPATSTYNDGAWHHVVGTYDGNTSRLYVDGNLSTSSARGAENPSSATSSLEIGGSVQVPACGSGFVGEIDDVRIYQRALSASEVSTLYTNGTSTATSTWSIRVGGGIFSNAAIDVAVDDSDLYMVGNAGSAQRIQKRGAQSGVLVWDDITLSGYPFGVAIDATYVYVAGKDSSPGNEEWSIAKLNKSDGVAAWSTSSNPSSNDDRAQGIAVDSSYVYAVGSDRSLGSSDSRWRMEKRNISDGSLVWATSSDFTGNDDIAYALTIDDTYMYVAGNEADDVVASTVWRIEKRALSDGSLAWAQRYTASSGSVYAIDDDTQFIYVAGKENTNAGGSAYQWRIEKRLK